MSDALAELTREGIAELRAASGVVLIDVWGPQCQPCLALAPTFADLAQRFDGSARFMKLEAPANRMACVELKVMSLPTFLAYRDGDEIGRLDGDIQPGELQEWVESVVTGDSDDQNAATKDEEAL